MEIKKTNSIASVNYAELKVSIDELEVYETAISFVLNNLSDEEIELKFGAKRDELEGICEDVKQAVAKCRTSELIAA